MKSKGTPMPFAGGKTIPELQGKPVLTTPGFKPLPSTVAEILSRPEGDGGPEYWIETERSIFKSNTLDGVFQLWRNDSDKSAVLDTGKLG